jgi:hypothetical protein
MEQKISENGERWPKTGKLLPSESNFIRIGKAKNRNKK